MLGILGFFSGSWLQSAAALGIGLTLGYGFGFLGGHQTAVAKYRVAALQTEVVELKKAADDKAKMIAADDELAQAQEEEVLRLRSRIKEIVDATPSRSDCKLSSVQLQQLKSVIGTN